MPSPPPLFIPHLPPALEHPPLSSCPDRTVRTPPANQQEEGELTLCWAGPFATFAIPFVNPTSEWLIVDSKAGVRKRGVFTAAQLNDPTYKKPSDCTKLLALVRSADKDKKA